jgi:hypothetical protein
MIDGSLLIAVAATAPAESYAKRQAGRAAQAQVIALH